MESVLIEKLEVESKASYRKLVFDVVNGEPLNSDDIRLTLFDAQKDRDQLAADVARLQDRKQAAERIEGVGDTSPRLRELLIETRDIDAAVAKLEDRHRLELLELQGRHEAEIAEAKEPLEKIAAERAGIVKPHEIANIKNELKAGCSQKTRGRAADLESGIKAAMSEMDRLASVVRGREMPNPAFNKTSYRSKLRRDRSFLEKEVARLNVELDRRKNESPTPFNPNHVLTRLRSDHQRATSELRVIAAAEVEAVTVGQRLTSLREQLVELEPKQLAWDDCDI